MARINVNETFPNFKFNTAYKNDVCVNDVLTGKTVFWVIRYIGCTVCRYDVHLLAQNYDAIKAKGAQVFVVMQSDQKHVQDDLKDVQLPFDIICDPTMEIYNSLEILPAKTKEELVGTNLEALKAKGAAAGACGFSHGDYEGDELQLPALFILDEKGTVTYAHYGKDIVDMPTVPELIEML